MQKNNPSLIIRTMRIEDIDAVVDIHRRCFSDKVSLFSVLHRRLAWHLYAQYVEELHSIGLVLEDIETGKIAGYAAGTLRPGFDRRFLWSHFPLVAWSVLVGLATHRTVWRMFFRSLLTHDPFGDYRQHPDRYEPEPPAGPVGYFMPIAMNPDYRGGGHAVRLAAALEDYFFELGVVRIRGNKIAIDNIASQKLFIDKLHWQSRTIENHCVIVWKDRELTTEQTSTGVERGITADSLRPRRMKLYDIPAVAELYMRCFPQRENTAYGKGYLERFCLQGLLEEKSVVVVLEDQSTGKIMAAAAGTLDPGFMLRFIKQNKCFFLCRLTLGYLKSSIVRKKVFRHLSLRFKKKSASTWPRRDEKTGQLIPRGTHLNHLFVCVDPDWQNKGIGKKILSFFMDALFDMGADRIWGCVETTNLSSLKLHSALRWESLQTSDEWFTIWAVSPLKDTGKKNKSLLEGGQ